MKRLSSRFSVLVTVTVMAGTTFAGIQDESTLSQLAGYREWTRMNSEPVKVESRMTVAVNTSAAMSAAV